MTEQEKALNEECGRVFNPQAVDRKCLRVMLSYPSLPKPPKQRSDIKKAQVKFKLLVLILVPMFQFAASATCNSNSPDECYSQGIAFKKACNLGHGLSCNHAGWNKRKNTDAQGSTESETLLFKKGCELSHPGSCYNYACILASAGQKNEAIGALKTAIINGYRNWVWIKEDPDLDSIRGETEFKKIMVRYSSDLSF